MLYSQTFQNYTNEALSGLDFLFLYINDVLLASKNQEEKEEHLRIVFERLAKYNLWLNRKKCVFAKKEVIFLSHVKSADGYHPTPKKVKRSCIVHKIQDSNAP